MTIVVAQEAPRPLPESASGLARPSRPLVASRVDAWLVGGLGIVVWLVMVGLPRATGVELPAFRGPLLWSLLAIIATHFGISYHLAYGQGREGLRRHPLALVVVPLVLAAGSLAIVFAMAVDVSAVARGGPRVGLVAVYSLTTWHYVKQTYGVVRLSAATTSTAIGARTAVILRYGLYPMWFFEAATVWSRGYRANDYGFDASFMLLPQSTVEIFRAGSIASALVIGVTLGALGIRHGRLPAGLWTPYMVAVLWIIWQPDHISALLVLGAVHALQYLACAHRAELMWSRERNQSQPVVGWCSVFGGAMAGGMLLTYWLPTWLGYADSRELGVTLAALVFIALNLHHYAVDAAIWRSRDGHVRRIVTG